MTLRTHMHMHTSKHILVSRQHFERLSAVAHLHSEGFAQEGAFQLLPLHPQGGEGCEAAVALVVCDEVVDDRWRDDIANILRILPLQGVQGI